MIDGKMPISSLVSLVPMDPERIASLLEMDDSGLPHLLRTATDTGWVWVLNQIYYPSPIILDLTKSIAYQQS